MAKEKLTASEEVAKDVRSLQQQLRKVEDSARERGVSGPAEHLKRADRELERVQEFDRNESPDE